MLNDKYIVLSPTLGFWRLDGVTGESSWDPEHHDGATEVTDELLQSDRIKDVKAEVYDMILARADSVAHISHRALCHDLVSKVVYDKEPAVIARFVSEATGEFCEFEGEEHDERLWTFGEEISLTDEELAREVEFGMSGMCPAKLIVLHEEYTQSFELYLDNKAAQNEGGAGGFYFLNKENPSSQPLKYYVTESGVEIATPEEMQARHDNGSTTLSI